MGIIDLSLTWSRGPGGARQARDRATWYGLGAASLLLVVAMALGGSFAAYLDLPAFLIVVGGTAAVTLVSFPLEEALALPEIVSGALFHRLAAPRAHAERLMRLARSARQNGVLTIENALPDLEDEPLLHKAMGLVADAVPREALERMLATGLQATLDRRRASAEILRRAGEVAPGLGLIGTLIGLVQMLANLSNPASLGPAMAVAILATLYGAILANVILLPLAAKLDRNGHAEALIGHLTIIASLAIADQESPRRLEEMLNGILPPAQRLDLFD